jgi:putative FmdB family regulatory protein
MMPNYDYRCLECLKRFEVFLSFDDYGKKEIACPYCHGQKVKRKIGRIRISRSDDSRFEDMSDPAALDSLEENPQAMGKMLRKMKSQMGEDTVPEFDEVVGRLESGETPEQIEAGMPNLGKDPGRAISEDGED